MKTRLILLTILVGMALSSLAQPFAITWSTIDGGGGTSTGGVYSVSGTIGQPDAGKMGGGQFILQGGFWGIVAAVQTPGAPWLSIELTNSVVRVYWPLPATGFVLEQTNRLTGVAGSWPQVPFPYQTNATHIYITVPQPAPGTFYRLWKP